MTKDDDMLRNAFASVLRRLPPEERAKLIERQMKNQKASASAQVVLAQVAAQYLKPN